jgi:D-glycero-D-manno-heptose 1,7-bisphosphate phosphatase
MAKHAKAIFLDLDGTLVRAFPQDPHPVHGPLFVRGPRTIDEIEILDETTESIERLEKAGYPCFVASNQPDIGRGIMNHRHYSVVIAEIAKLVGLSMARFGICPHSGEWCACRKPKPGLIYQAAVGYELDLSRCWLVGDRETDREAAIRAGIPPSQTIKIETNQGIREATKWILANST